MKNFLKVFSSKRKISWVSFEMVKVVSILVLIVLTFFPFSLTKVDISNVKNVSFHLYPLTAVFSGHVKVGLNLFFVSCVFLYFLPIAVVFNVVSFFYKKIKGLYVYFGNLVVITMYLFSAIYGMILFANTARWFDSVNTFAYIAFFSAVFFHVLLVGFGIIHLKIRSESFLEYEKFLMDEEKKEINERKQFIEKLEAKRELKKNSYEDVLKIDQVLVRSKENLKKYKKKTHIKTKIMQVFLITIMTILAIFAYSNLRNYKTLLTQNIDTAGKNQAEQVAAIYVFSDGLHEKIRAFFDGIKKTNGSSLFPFERVDIITTSSKSLPYIEKVESQNDLPAFNVFSYTTAVGHVRSIPDDEKKIVPTQAFDFIKHYKNEYTRNKPIYRNENKICMYVYPILFSARAGHKIIGFSVVSYLSEVLEEPYFQAKVFIISLSLVFLYVSLIVTIFLADFIANPIICLSGNIRKTANALSKMLSGNAKIDADKLVFKSDVSTNDEIKNLSVEIKNIVSLVRGVLPYVSFHTLQNAEKRVKHRSYKRDLCFLFTDIRGFTNLCENMEAKDVISILNKYLDLETKIIFENNGDIDKYVGDEIMAFFSGPRKEINACKAAMEIKKAIRKEQIASLKAGQTPVSIGIGINSGEVVFGPVGSETRKDFTAIGDTVNLAARLEGTNKVYGSKSIISESVYKSLNNNFICRELDFVAVKGKSEAVRIFEILQPTEKLKENDLQSIKTVFETGLSYYRKRNWTSAEKYFTKCLEKYNDIPSKVFLKRIEHYKITPPKSTWSGVFVMNSK